MKVVQCQVEGLIALAALAITAPAQGQGGPGSADSFSYRCHILGEASACWVLEASQRGDPVPGPYAVCLASKGAGRDEALAAAATLGERPVVPRQGRSQPPVRQQVQGGAPKRADRP